MTGPISAHQFVFGRLILGFYLLLHFIFLMPVAVSLFSNQGMIPDPNVMATWGAIPSFFLVGDSPVVVYVVLVVGMLLSLSLSLGFKRRWVALGLWIIWMSLFNRNILISNPSIPFIGMLLLLMFALPSGEPDSIDEPRSGWAFPKWVYWGLLLTLMGSYTASGLHKLTAPSWIDGSALFHILELPLARDLFLREWVLALPETVLKAMTWSALCLEILALPLCLIPFTRRWIWMALVMMNLGVLSVINFSDLTFGVLVMHLFCFHRSWLKPAKMKSSNPIIFFDGVCSLCNSVVDFAIAEDPLNRFHFASIQSKTAEGLDAIEVQRGESMALQDGDVLYTKSDAVLRVASGLGGVWRVLSWSRLIIPKAFRDAVYFQVQLRRYAIFGKRDTCRMPTAEERARFLP